MKKPDSTEALPASALIDQRIADLADWRGQTLSRMRQLIRAAIALNTAAKAKPRRAT